VSPSNRIAAAAFLGASGVGTFLGFYECGAYVWVRQLVFGGTFLSITSLLVAFVVAQRKSTAMLSLGSLLGQGVAFVIASVIIFVAFQALGEIIYLPPQSLGEFWHDFSTFSFGCR
jgi:hypothetical protein